MFVAITLFGMRKAEQAAIEEDALREQGISVERVKISMRGRSSHVMSSREQAADSGLLLYVLAFGGAAAAGLVAFFAAGGKLSAEHARGLRNMR